MENKRKNTLHMRMALFPSVSKKRPLEFITKGKGDAEGKEEMKGDKRTSDHISNFRTSQGNSNNTSVYYDNKPPLATDPPNVMILRPKREVLEEGQLDEEVDDYDLTEDNGDDVHLQQLKSFDRARNAHD